ncbi:hypothetical protein NPIL_458311 [Nephila pilipes]|uniref:Uncharacterized protein n=1 Tax=Nephila pilipes TaxID=299642 RepID=A0A8X6UPK2_NEPPI|nr:hypothetical protein NPIL_458311 [Nephila pilipes]
MGRCVSYRGAYRLHFIKWTMTVVEHNSVVGKQVVAAARYHSRFFGKIRHHTTLPESIDDHRIISIGLKPNHSSMQNAQTDHTNDQPEFHALLGTGQPVPDHFGKENLSQETASLFRRTYPLSPPTPQINRSNKCKPIKRPSDAEPIFGKSICTQMKMVLA